MECGMLMTVAGDGAGRTGSPIPEIRGGSACPTSSAREGVDPAPRRRQAFAGPGGGRSALLAGLLALSTLLPGAAEAQGSGEVGIALGTPAPPAAVEDLDGSPVDLLEYVRGKPALIEFWATWCEICEALQPQLDRIQAEWGDRVNVVAVAVAVNQNPRRVRRHIEAHDPGYAYLWDARGAAVRAYGALTTSVVVILDADGRVAYTGVGRDQDLVAAVERVLGS